VGNPYLLTLLEGTTPTMTRPQKGLRISRHGPQKGQQGKSKYDILLSDVAGE
jgi:hypothetical protein